MIITAHQPEHLPYFGFLDKVNKSDVFVVLDDVQYTKQNFQNRNRILSPNGPRWLTVPITKHNESSIIKDQKTTSNWKTKYKNQVVEAYRKYPYFNEGLNFIEQMLDVDSDRLIDYNMCYIDLVFDALNINTRMIMSSSLELYTTGAQRIHDICSLFEHSYYMAGPGSEEYMDTTTGTLTPNTKFSSYPQINSDSFVSHLSSLDIIMSVGVSGLLVMLSNSNAVQEGVHLLP